MLILVAYFQGESEPADWQSHINGVLRFYMDTNLAAQADAGSQPPAEASMSRDRRGSDSSNL